MMRWWPPLLHLGVIGGAVALALLRFDALADAALFAGPGAAENAAQPAQGATGAPDFGGAATVVDLAALAARPLFVAGRQPFDSTDKTESPTPDLAAPAPEFRMVGYLNDGNRPRAILSVDPASPDVILQENDEIQGFTVSEIDKNSIVLRNDDKEITIKMFNQ